MCTGASLSCVDVRLGCVRGVSDTDRRPSLEGPPRGCRGPSPRSHLLCLLCRGPLGPHGGLWVDVEGVGGTEASVEFSSALLSAVSGSVLLPSTPTVLGTPCEVPGSAKGRGFLLPSSLSTTAGPQRAGCTPFLQAPDTTTGSRWGVDLPPSRAPPPAGPDVGDVRPRFGRSVDVGGWTEVEVRVTGGPGSRRLSGRSGQVVSRRLETRPGLGPPGPVLERCRTRGGGTPGTCESGRAGGVDREAVCPYSGRRKTGDFPFILPGGSPTWGPRPWLGPGRYSYLSPPGSPPETGSGEARGRSRVGLEFVENDFSAVPLVCTSWGPPRGFGE